MVSCGRRCGFGFKLSKKQRSGWEVAGRGAALQKRGVQTAQESRAQGPPAPKCTQFEMPSFLVRWRTPVACPRRRRPDAPLPFLKNKDRAAVHLCQQSAMLHRPEKQNKKSTPKCDISTQKPSEDSRQTRPH